MMVCVDPLNIFKREIGVKRTYADAGSDLYGYGANKTAIFLIPLFSGKKFVGLTVFSVPQASF
jgi:hypothetical protein